MGIDLREQKVTLPLLCALESVSPEEQAAIRTLVSQISDMPELAVRVRDFVLDRDGVASAASEMEKCIDDAVLSLEVLPQSEEKSYLAELARFVGERTY